MSVFNALTHFANPALEKVMAQLHQQLLLLMWTNVHSSSAQQAQRSSLVLAISLNRWWRLALLATQRFLDQRVVLKIGDTEITGYTSKGIDPAEAKAKDAEFKKQIREALNAAGYPAKADSSQINYVAVLLLLVYLVILVTMVYGPIAAVLVEIVPNPHSLHLYVLAIPCW